MPGDGVRGGENMHIKERRVGAVTILDLSGKLALGDGDGLLKDKIHSLMNQDQKHVALNLGDLSYVDSAGLGELVAAQNTVARSGGVIKVFNLTKRVSDLLTITKVLTVFDVHNTEGEALQSFPSGAAT
jgi:anti-sigma B factor antagonist